MFPEKGVGVFFLVPHMNLNFDRMLIGMGPLKFEVVDPKWWRIDRWFVWLFCKERSTVVVDERQYVVRCREFVKK